MAPTPDRQEASRPHPSSQSSHNRDGHGAQNIRILLVEDSPVNRKIVLHILKRKLGCTVDSASDGAEAIQALRTARYDLVLMDCQMPVMDGYAAVAAIRNPNSDVLDHDVRIVAITADTTQGAREKCLAAGMDDFITKPTMPSQLADVLERNLPENNAPRTGIIPVDAEWTDDPELARILADFVESLPSKMTAMRLALDNNYYEEVRRIAHQLKGTGGGYGYPALTESARGLENAARAECRQTARAALVQLSTLCQAVKAGHHAAVMTQETQS